jgi:hypothetical protein
MWWYIKQLLPLKWTSTYACEGRLCRDEWRMWLGRCFAIKQESCELPA